MDELVQDAINKVDKIYANQIKTYAIITQTLGCDVKLFKVWLDAFVEAVLIVPFDHLVNAECIL